MKTISQYKASPSCWLPIPINGMPVKTTLCNTCKDEPEVPKTELKEWLSLLSFKSTTQQYAAEDGCHFRETKAFKPTKAYLNSIRALMPAKTAATSQETLRKFCAGKLQI